MAYLKAAASCFESVFPQTEPEFCMSVRDQLQRFTERRSRLLSVTPVVGMFCRIVRQKCLCQRRGGVWLAIGKAREEVSGLHVLVGKVAASSGSCNYCHFLSITRQLELLKISN